MSFKLSIRMHLATRITGSTWSHACWNHVIESANARNSVQLSVQCCVATGKTLMSLHQHHQKTSPETTYERANRQIRPMLPVSLRRAFAKQCSSVRVDEKTQNTPLALPPSLQMHEATPRRTCIPARPSYMAWNCAVSLRNLTKHTQDAIHVHDHILFASHNLPSFMRGCHQRACGEEHDVRITSLASREQAPAIQHVHRLTVLMMMRHLRRTTVHACRMRSNLRCVQAPRVETQGLPPGHWGRSLGAKKSQRSLAQRVISSGKQTFRLGEWKSEKWPFNAHHIASDAVKRNRALRAVRTSLHRWNLWRLRCASLQRDFTVVAAVVFVKVQHVQ